MSKTQDFLNEYMEEYISSIQGPGKLLKPKYPLLRIQADFLIL